MRAATVFDYRLEGSHWRKGYSQYPSAVKPFGMTTTGKLGSVPTMTERHERLRQARLEAGFERGSHVLDRYPSWNRNSYKSNENGNAGFSWEQAKVYAKAFGVRPEWLFDGTGPMRAGATPMIRVIGRVGADSSGEVVMTTADESWDLAPLAPGGSTDDSALEVVGHSMPWLARDGSLIYFNSQRTPPTPDMLGYPVVVETEDGRVLVKRLLRGSGPKLYDLESENGPTIPDQRLRWAAEITAIIPPKQARRIILRASEAA